MPQSSERTPIAIYRGMDRATLDAAYNNGEAVKDSADWLARWRERSAAIRARPDARLDIVYGQRPRARLDNRLRERRAEDQNAGLTEGFAEELEDAAREDQAGNPGAEAEDLADRVEPAPRDRQPARVHLITCSSGWVANSVCVNT